MMRRKKVKLVYLILLIGIVKVTPLLAQGTYKYKADVDKIDSSTVYRIELKPEFIAKSQNNLQDIKLIDNKGKYIAYILGSKLSNEDLERFIDFPAVQSNTKADSATTYVAANKNKLDISRLWIKIRNTAVNRSVNLTGSDDLKNWFAIKEDIQLQESTSDKYPEYEQVLDFPASNYRYFKIQVNGKKGMAPVNILQSGIYISDQTKPEFSMLPTVKFNTKDTANTTEVFIHLAEPYLVNKFHLNISSPKYYNRDITVYSIENRLVTRICDAKLSSKGPSDILLSAKATQFQIDISNGDDNPIKIKSIDAYQQKQFAMSYLDEGHSYYLLTGDSSAEAANYDLSFLENRVVSLLPVVTHAGPYKNIAFKAIVPAAKPNYTLLIWGAIIVALLLLSLLTWRMVKEINLKGQK